MAEYSSYGTLEETLPHIGRVVLDNGEFIDAREVRAYILQLRQQVEDQGKLLHQFGDVARAFEHADELAQGFGRPQYDQARDRLAATYEGWRTYEQRRGKAP